MKKIYCAAALSKQRPRVFKDIYNEANTDTDEYKKVKSCRDLLFDLSHGSWKIFIMGLFCVFKIVPI
jgi:hypothetical protein